MTENLLDVLVVGAGPVGLFCANELTRHGLRCRIVDKKLELSDKSKALALHIRTLDLLDDCGFIDEVLIQGHQVDGALFKSKNKQLIDVNFAGLEANRHFLIDLPQDKTERILYKGLVDKNLNVEWQTELTKIEQNTKGITALLKHADGSSEKVKASWIIACDGSHSILRNLVNAEFIGDAFKQTWWLVDLHIDWNLPANKMVIYVSSEGPLACFPIGEKRYRLVLTAPEKISHEEPSLADIEREFKKRCADQAILSDPLWISQFGISHRQIKQYRYERVFFAGDAAHVHSPMGGQGLNTGMQDIYNLVWKLALVQKGFAHEKLLDSYHLERHPIGEDVLKKTGIMTNLIMLTNPVLIALRNAFLSLITSFDFVKKTISKDLAELTISYAKSPIVKKMGTGTRFRIGEFPPNFYLTEAQHKDLQQLHEITQGTAHHLFLFAGKESAGLSLLLKTASCINQQFSNIVKTHIVLAAQESEIPDSYSVFLDVNQEIQRRFELKETTALLIRPDKYIGLVQSPVNQDELMRYMEEIYVNK